MLKIMSNEAVLRRYERMSLASTARGYDADGSYAVHLWIGSVRLPLRLDGDRIVGLGRQQLARHVLADLVAGLARLPSPQPATPPANAGGLV